MPDKDLVFLKDNLHLVPASKRAELVGRTPRTDARTVAEVKAIVGGERFALGMNRCLATASATDRSHREIRDAVLHVARTGGRRAVELMHGTLSEEARRVAQKVLPYLAEAGPMDPGAAAKSFGRLVRSLEERAGRVAFADIDDGSSPLERLKRWRGSRVAFLNDRIVPSMRWEDARPLLEAAASCAYSATMGRSARLEAFAALHPDKAAEIRRVVGMPVNPPLAAGIVDGRVREREAAARVERPVGEATWTMLRIARMRASGLPEADRKIVEDAMMDLRGPQDVATDARRSALQRVFVTNKIASTDLEVLFARLARVETMRKEGDMLAEVEADSLAGDLATALETLSETRSRLTELAGRLGVTPDPGPSPSP